MRYLIVLISFALLACNSSDPHGHSHEDHDGHDHPHNEVERPALSYTFWSDKTEIFVEFPALVVGHSSRFAAHFTILDGHKPVEEGTLSVSLLKDGSGTKSQVDSPSSSGIFTPSIRPKKAGIFKLVFSLQSSKVKDQFTIEGVQVYGSVEEAVKMVIEEEENGNTISFLKEQAWKIPFQTVEAMQKEVFQTIPTSGRWEASPSSNFSVAAPSSGIVTFNALALTPGSYVKAGQELLKISSAQLTNNNLSAEIATAKANFDQAESEYERKKDLFESEIIPQSEFEITEQKYLVAKSKYETLVAGYQNGGKAVRSPINGYIQKINLSLGQYVEQGELLVEVTGENKRILTTQVSPEFSAELGHIHNLWYEVGKGKWSNISESGGKILSVSRGVSSAEPLLTVYAEINEDVQLPLGSFSEARIEVGEARQGVVVPQSSLMEDFGNYSVIVQLSGESFERRDVIPGRKNGREVEITQGIEAGEVVVSQGAFQVKMASMSGQAPSHGHAH